MRWGESRNLKLLRAFLIGFPSVFLISFFGILDEIDRAHGGPGLPFGWGAAVLLVVLVASWMPSVPRPAVLRLPSQGGSPQSWGLRILRAALVFVGVLLVVGLAWGVVTDISARDLGVEMTDFWGSRVMFSFLFALSSLLFTLGPEETLIGDLHSWSRAETKAVLRFMESLAVGWATLTVPFLLVAAALTGMWDVGPLLPFGLFLGTLLGLTVYAMSGSLRKPSRMPTNERS